MRLSTLIKIVAAFIVLTVLTGTLIVVNDLKKKISSRNSPEIVLGAPALLKAKKVLTQGRFDEAKVLLKDIVVKYEDTPAEIEAYRILGEMNMDELFEVQENDERFVEYTVKSGDTYLGIIHKHQTNFDLMMLINEMTSKNSSGLQPNQKLLLMPLHFSLRIVPHRNQLLLVDNDGEVLKIYEPIVDMTIPAKPANKGTRLEVAVSKIAAYYNGSRVNATRGNYRESSKVISIQNPSIEIIGETTSVSNDFKGVVLSKPDMEELVLLLRSGNKVEILY